MTKIECLLLKRKRGQINCIYWHKFNFTIQATLPFIYFGILANPSKVKYRIFGTTFEGFFDSAEIEKNNVFTSVVSELDFCEPSRTFTEPSRAELAMKRAEHELDFLKNQLIMRLIFS